MLFTGRPDKSRDVLWTLLRAFIHQYFQLTVHAHPCSSFDVTKESLKKQYSGSTSSVRTYHLKG
jgi:hypothetical protein